MPTGFTELILKGADFKEFAMQCSRAFGALILMRDDPLGTPIPQEIKPETKYHEDGLKRAQKDLAKLKKMTAPQKAAAAQKEYKAECVERGKYRIKELADKARLERVLEQVKQWNPPTTDHTGIKEFMIQQITDTIKWDCDNYVDRVKKLTPKGWYDKKVKEAKWHIEYHTKHMAEEIERAKGRNEWLKVYRESIMVMPDVKPNVKPKTKKK